jgi:hypothetical protein
MNTKLVHLVNEIYDWNIEARAELQHQELDELEKWVEADQAIVDQEVKRTQGRLASAKGFEFQPLLKSLNRLLARARKLEQLDEAIEKERDKRMHRADEALEKAVFSCNTAHRFICDRGRVAEPDPAA